MRGFWVLTVFVFGPPHLGEGQVSRSVRLLKTQ